LRITLDLQFTKFAVDGPDSSPTTSRRASAMKLIEDKEPGDNYSVLEIRDVVKSFGGIKAVDHCTFRVGQGKITGLIGPNGAGKTSLFDLITGFLKVTSGSIWFSGQRIDGLTPHQIFHRGILRTFQIPRSSVYNLQSKVTIKIDGGLT